MTPAEVERYFDELHGWALARAGRVRTVAYGDHPDQALDLYGPETSPAHLLVVHGGFWRAPFTRRNTAALAAGLAEAGWATANVEYRRLGPGEYRPVLDDLVRAREALGPVDHVVAVGHSAGGQLALWLAAEGLVDGAVALAGVCDLAAAAADRLGGDAVSEWLGGAPEEVPDAGSLDPAARLPLRRPHVLVHAPDDDRVPIGHARRYAERAAAAGDDCRLVEVEGGHFALVDPRSAAWPAVVDAVASLSADRLGAAAS